MPGAGSRCAWRGRSGQRATLPLPLPLVLALLLALVACAGPANRSNRSNSPNASNDSNRTPSCLPPGYRPCPPGAAEALGQTELPGQELDVKLAVVEGEVITRRRLVRQMGPRAPGMSEEVYERQLRQRLRQRARVILFAREARRSGISVPQQAVDDIAEDQLRKGLREAAQTMGRPVTAREYLAENNLTMDEFRASIQEQLLSEAYLRRLAQGLPGTRPQVDMRVSPAEVRRIYWSHPGAFDVQRGVRFVFWQFSVERYLSDDVGFLDAEAKAREEAERLAAAFRAGGDPEALAQGANLEEGAWRETETFAEREGLERQVGPDAAAWLFDPARRAGDATIVPDAGGPVVLGVREIRPAERIPYEEAYEKIVVMYERVRQRRLQEQRLIEILSTRNVVSPPRVLDEMLYESEMVLAELDRDPILAAARFR